MDGSAPALCNLRLFLLDAVFLYKCYAGTRNKKLSRKLSLLRAKSNAEIAALAREFGLQEGQNLILEEADCSGEREEDCETLQVLIMDVNEQDNDDVQDETT